MDGLLARKQIDVGKAVKLMESMKKCRANEAELIRVRVYLRFIKTTHADNEHLYNKKRDRAYNYYEIKELERKYGGNK